MSHLLVEGYVEDQSAQRKAVESSSSIAMICNILDFLDASPMTLFEGPPSDRKERDQFYQENMDSLISCVVAADESVRRLACGVAKRLYAKEQIMKTIRHTKGLESKGFKIKFWQLTYVVFSLCSYYYYCMMSRRIPMLTHPPRQFAHHDVDLR